MVQLPHQHGKNPSYVLEDMPKDGDFSAVSEIFHSVSDPKRLKLFWLLCHYEECVINLSALMGMSSPALSHHLKVLKAQGLIKSRRVGKEMYYTAADGLKCSSIFPVPVKKSEPFTKKETAHCQIILVWAVF